MAAQFRVVDSGIADGRRQIALDQAMIELHKAGRTPDTVRFMGFPPTVLIGRHQALRHEVRLDHCRANGIGLVRRITGGGAIYLDQGQVGWELVLSRRRLPMRTLGDYTGAICEAVADGLAKVFGIDARFRPRSDIEVAGRKLCGTGGFFDGDTLIYQGTVLVDADPARMIACLNVPAASPATRDLDRAEARLVTLKELLPGRAISTAEVREAVLAGLTGKLGLSVAAGELTDAEADLACRCHDEEIGTDAFVFEIDSPGGAGVATATRRTPGGTISAYVRLEGARGARRIRELLLTGDFFALPPRVVYDVEAALRGVPVADLGAAVERGLAGSKHEVFTIPAASLREVVVAAAEQGAP